MKKLTILIFTLIVSSGFCDIAADKQKRIDTINKIIKKAEKDWPDNYRMQELQIESECNSLTKLEALKKQMNISETKE